MPNVVADSTLCVSILYHIRFILCTFFSNCSQSIVRGVHLLLTQQLIWQYFPNKRLYCSFRWHWKTWFPHWEPMGGPPVGDVAERLNIMLFVHVCAVFSSTRPLSVCLCLPPCLCAQHYPGIHLQCHFGHYDNGCNSLPPGAPQPSHCSPGGRPANCAAPLASPKGNCLIFMNGLEKQGAAQTEANLTWHARWSVS